MTKKLNFFYLHTLKLWGTGALQITGGSTELALTPHLLNPILESFPLFYKTRKQTSSSDTNQIKMPL